VAVYGVVAAIVKMDDVGLSLAQRSSARAKRIGRGLVAGMPIALRWLSLIGIAAMLWVGGHIVLVGAHELGWHPPYDLVHDVAHSVGDVGVAGGVLEWLVGTAVSGAVGLAIGIVGVTIVAEITKRKRSAPAHA
jgi:predicted DNA repair protein MutK